MFTSIPVLVGIEAGVGSRLRWELAIAGGVTPEAYVRVIQGLAEEETDSDVIRATLGQALAGQAQVRLFPATGFGLFLAAGYEVYRVNGIIEVDPAGAVSGQAIEEPDTGRELPPGGGDGFDPFDPPRPPGGDGSSEEPEVSRRREEVTSFIHALRFGLGYRQHLGHFFLQGEIAVIKAVAASSSPDDLDEYLEGIYTENLLVPLLCVVAGFRI